MRRRPQEFRRLSFVLISNYDDLVFTSLLARVAVPKLATDLHLLLVITAGVHLAFEVSDVAGDAPTVMATRGVRWAAAWWVSRCLSLGFDSWRVVRPAVCGCELPTVISCRA